MSEGVANAGVTDESAAAEDNGAALREPFAALVVGGVAGLLAFELCALFLGPEIGIAIALVAAAASLVRRAIVPFALFTAACALSALAFVQSTRLLLGAAIPFAIGLALLARASAPARR